MSNQPEGISRKEFLQLAAPSEEDAVSSQERILRELRGRGYNAVMPAGILRSLYPLCEEAKWELTAALAWDGSRWTVTGLEAGDTRNAHYGFAADLGSTTVVMQLYNCETGELLGQESAWNRQIAFGEDILTRIFYAHENTGGMAGEQSDSRLPSRTLQEERYGRTAAGAGHPEEIRKATVDTFLELMYRLADSCGVCLSDCISMTVAGNTTMIHFLIGMDAFCVFSAPWAVQANAPGFLRAKELGLPLPGYVYIFPAKANYLGGDIISGLAAAEMHRREEISLFFDVGTNGELVIGNRDFLLCGAGAAGPALEGGVVRTGMRAAPGAVEGVTLQDGCFRLQVIGGGKPKGICGSGIIDLIAELFRNGWVDLRGKLQPEKSPLISLCPSSGSGEDTDRQPEREVAGQPQDDQSKREVTGQPRDGLFEREAERKAAGWLQGDLSMPDGSDRPGLPTEDTIAASAANDMPEKMEYAVCYAPGLWFYQSDIDEFIRTKAAAYTMMEYLMEQAGLGLDDIRDFYMAGAFGAHVNKESAITIGMYPDVERARIHAVGNMALAGAAKLLLHLSVLDGLDDILELMTYVQFGEVDNFLDKMTAACALPHTDIDRYPTVKESLRLRF